MREDRHGRTARADHDRRRRPSDGFRVRDLGRFRQIVADAMALLPAEVVDALAGAQLVVEELPPPGPSGEAVVPLASFEPSDRGGRIVVYRRPLEARTLNRVELTELARLAIGREVAITLGLDIDLEDDWDDEG